MPFSSFVYYSYDFQKSVSNRIKGMQSTYYSAVSPDKPVLLRKN